MLSMQIFVLFSTSMNYVYTLLADSPTRYPFLFLRMHRLSLSFCDNIVGHDTSLNIVRSFTKQKPNLI